MVLYSVILGKPLITAFFLQIITAMHCLYCPCKFKVYYVQLWHNKIFCRDYLYSTVESCAISNLALSQTLYMYIFGHEKVVDQGLIPFL